MIYLPLTMKQFSRILGIALLALFIIVPMQHVEFAHAQVSECSDMKDNDGDGGIDVKGIIRMEGPRQVKYPPDKQCEVAGATCEDGTKTCPTPGTGGQDGGTLPPNTTAQPGGTLTGTQSDFPLQVRLQNPLKVNTIQGAIKLFMDTVVKIAIPFIVVFFIWSGINFILARGNATKIGEAKKMFWYTVIGTLLILGAWAITDAIVGTINSIAS